MSAADALRAARAAGVSVGIDGDDLVLQASAAPPPAVLDALLRHKPTIVALLRPANDEWSAEDWQAFFDERAGIAEFDGGLPRNAAEAKAFECCVAEWLNCNAFSCEETVDDLRVEASAALKQMGILIGREKIR